MLHKPDCFTGVKRPVSCRYSGLGIPSCGVVLFVFEETIVGDSAFTTVLTERGHAAASEMGWLRSDMNCKNVFMQLFSSPEISTANHAEARYTTVWVVSAPNIVSNWGKLSHRRGLCRLR